MSKLRLVFLFLAVFVIIAAVSVGGFTGLLIAVAILAIANSIIFGEVCPKCRKLHAGKLLREYKSLSKEHKVYKCKYCEHQWEQETARDTGGSGGPGDGGGI